MTGKLQTWLFYLLVLLLPLNLGKHFIISEAFVKTYLVDYLVPVIWGTDLIVFLILVVWFISGGLKELPKEKYTKFVFLFLVSLLSSIAVSSRILPSAFVFVSLVLHALFALFVAAKVSAKIHFEKITSVLAVSVILLSVLALVQWQAQGSAFNNYLFFGEQPHNSSTENIALTSLFGSLRVPVYGTFRHPNVFGGFLAIVLLWIFSQLLLGKKEGREAWRNALYAVSLVAGLTAMILTFSQVAGAALILGALFLLLIKKAGKPGVIFSIVVTLLIFLFGLFLPVFPKLGLFQDNPSIYRRANLQRSAYMMLKENTLFGVGLNNFTVRVEDYLPPSQILRFTQPTHNIFVLLLAEAGVFAFITFLALLIFVAVTLLEQPFGIPAVLFVTILQIFIIGSLDHYLLTIQQTQLLFWLTVGLALTYTKKDVEV